MFAEARWPGLARPQPARVLGTSWQIPWLSMSPDRMGSPEPFPQQPPLKVSKSTMTFQAEALGPWWEDLGTSCPWGGGAWSERVAEGSLSYGG